jgi:hypothetical protein
MLKAWLDEQGTTDDHTTAEEVLERLWEAVDAAPEEEISGFLTLLSDSPNEVLAHIPLYDQDLTELFCRIIDRLNPNPEQGKILSARFPLTWSVSVMGGPGFEARPLLNGVILVRNMHRVLGPALWEGLTFGEDPELIETLKADLATLRARNLDGEPSCFLLTHDAEGARLIGSEEPVDLTAPGWGQLIAVCALQPEDLEGEEALQCEALRGVGSRARAGVVFLRLFGDRVDLIPASRFDDDLDIFLEELAAFDLSAELEEGAEIGTPLQEEALITEILERASYETGHLEGDGAGPAWFRDHALPALARRLASAMTYETVNFGLGPDPDGPRRAVPLPAGVEAAIAADPDLKRRSITLQVMTFSETARDMILDGLVLEQISEAFEDVGAHEVEITITGRVDHDLGAEAEVPPLTGPEELSAAFGAALGEISERAEEAGEDPEDAIVDASLGVVLLIDFLSDRPSDMTIASAVCTLSGSLEDTVRLFLNGRGEYLAYADGEVDSGDHELFRLDQDEDGYGEDEPDDRDPDESGEDEDGAAPGGEGGEDDDRG